jgi:hypothetical protein
MGRQSDANLVWREAECIELKARIGQFSEGLINLTREESPMGTARKALENQSTSVVTTHRDSGEGGSNEILGISRARTDERRRSAELPATTESRNAQGNQASDIQNRACRPPLSEQGVTEAFRTHNDKRRAQGELLRQAVARIDEAHMGPRLLTAREVRASLDLAALRRTKPPTLRAVQIHLRAYRHERFERLLAAAPGHVLRELLRVRRRRK